MKRKIIQIDEDKCNGCGLCIPNCHEGALQIIDGKARLISDLFCDGLGACIGHCPESAIEIIEREAEPYDEKKVMKENIVPKGENTIKAHLKHLKEHNADDFLKEGIEYLKENNIEVPNLEEEKMNLACGCPGTMVKSFDTKCDNKESDVDNKEQQTELRQWPVQMHLLPPSAPFFKNADVAFIADCVAVANPNLHKELIKGKAIAIGCPKLDDIVVYKEKFKAIIEQNNLNTITVAVMEVPCCGGWYSAVEEALDESGKRITLKKIVVGVDGSIK